LTSHGNSAESTADFIHKLSISLKISLKEARETRYWILLLSESELVKNSRLQPLLNELEELIKIITSIIVSKKRKINY
jgi:four helix bundle protein